MEGQNISKVKKTVLIVSFLSSPFFLMLIALFVVVLFVTGAFDGDGSSSSGKCVSLPNVSTVCKTITVAGEGTMSIDEYIAGVIKAEVGGLKDDALDMYKAGAIAARSYVLANATQDDNGNCTVENGQHFQAYKADPTEEQIQAANETSGMVLIKDGNIYSSQYDAFCYDSKDSNYYYVCQGNGGFTDIPISWADSIVPSDYRAAPRTYSHGNGMSQYGAYYLITKEGKNYQDVLTYFYGDDGATLGSINESSSVCGGTYTTLDSYDLGNSDLNVLNRTLSSSEQTELNNYLEQEITKAGRGTGGAVAAAGQSLVYWLRQKGYFLQYYWGGGHGGFGDGNYTFTYTNPNWGSTKFGGDDHYPSTRIYLGMDCSGFVAWATRTACKASFGAPVSGDWESLGNGISLSEATPGDVIAWNSHIQLVVKNNGDGSVIVAEESGGDNGLVFSQINSTTHKVVDMDNWYANNCENISAPTSSSSSGSLEQQIESYLDQNSSSGIWSIYVKNLKTNSTVNINSDTKMIAASEIKLFMMAALYDQIKANKISESTVKDQIRKMITNSDNDVTNNLIDKFGMDMFNNYITNNNYKNTTLKRKMLSSGPENYTSAKDIGTLLEKIYKGTLVSSEYSNKMLELLKDQENTTKIPAGVPSGTVVANKTGELSTVEHDAAIVYSSGADYIIVVMSKNLKDTDQAKNNITKISEIVYNYYN